MVMNRSNDDNEAPINTMIPACITPVAATIDNPVIVRNACKSFATLRSGEDSILVNLNMTVAKGTIYGLLGPSGCGKTTLLRCIIGRLRLERGYIRTLGQVPGSPGSGVPGPRLGYMPQEDALDGVMTIVELLNYYGSILGMSKKRIKEKVSFLIDFLKLPSKKAFFRTLSGGQRRRVSFAVALIHDAELLILDEPTVGVDSILKQNIWDYLFHLVQNGKTTVIITTHYIEEARGSNSVGMMLEGRLVAEDSPENLLKRFAMATLQDVFLSICLNRKFNPSTISDGVADYSKAHCSRIDWSCSQPACSSSAESLNDGSALDLENVQSISQATFGPCEPVKASSLNILNVLMETCSDIKIKRLQAIIYRGYLQFIRFPGLLVMLMVSPAFQIALCGFSLGRSVNSVPLGVVNRDAGDLGNKFLSHINAEVVIQKEFRTWEIARHASKSGETWGAVMLGVNFSSSLVDRFNNTPHVNQKTLLESYINVSLDGSNFLFAETIRFTLLDAFEKFLTEFLKEFGLEQSLSKMPLKKDTPIFGKFEDPFSVFIMPAFITGSTFFAGMGFSIIVFFLDKEGGKLERIYVAGVTPIEVISGFLVLHMVVMIAEVVLLFVMAFIIFKFNNEGSIVLLLGLSMSQGMCGAMIGVLISTCSKRFHDTSLVSMTTIVSSVALGGYFWPLEATSSIVRFICLSLPFAISAEAMRHIMYNRWDLTHPEIQLAFGLTLAWLVVFMLACVTVLRMKKSRENS